MTGSAPAFLSALLRADTTQGWSPDHREWTSAVLSPGFEADQVVASWNVATASGVLIEACAADARGTWGPWQALARWDAAEGATRSSPAPGAAAPTGPATVVTDVLTARHGQAITAARLRITVTESAADAVDGREALRLAALHFSAPDNAGPSALASRPARATTDPGRDEARQSEAKGTGGAAAGGSGAVGTAAAEALRPLSQRQHKARTDLGGGGSSWCSPTSLAMVMDAWGVDIPAEEVRPDRPATEGDPRVPWVAARVFDPAFGGTGNWAFNVALAGYLGLDAVVTRLSSLAELGTLTRAGFPVICSVAFGQEDMPGADYSTAGHLLVALALDAQGNVRVADPACDTPPEGLRAYPGQAFDTAWSTSRRTVYLLCPGGAKLPAVPEGSRSW